MSDSRSAESGVPHGSVLGPTLFLLLVYDLPDVLEGKVLLFADDAKIIAPRSDYNILQHNLRAAWSWSEAWSLPLNADNVFTFQLVNVLLFHSRCMMMHQSALQKARGILEFSSPRTSIHLLLLDSPFNERVHASSKYVVELS